MRIVPLVLAVVGFVFLAVGIAMLAVSPDTIPCTGPNTIPCTGRIVHLDGDLKSIESDSSTNVDVRGYSPIIVGVGLLSAALLYRTVEKKSK